RHRRRTGEGQRIDIAQTEPTIAMLANAVIRLSANGVDAGPQGNRIDGCCPRGVYPCAGEDRWIAISVASDGDWKSLAAVLGREINRPEWSSSEGRLQEQDQIDAAISSLTVRHDAHELMGVLQARGIAAGVVQTAKDIVAGDAQLKHIGHWRRLRHREMGDMTFNGLPFRFESVALGPLSAAPLIG